MKTTNYIILICAISVWTLVDARPNPEESSTDETENSIPTASVESVEDQVSQNQTTSEYQETDNQDQESQDQTTSEYQETDNQDQESQDQSASEYQETDNQDQESQDQTTSEDQETDKQDQENQDQTESAQAQSQETQDQVSDGNENEESSEGGLDGVVSSENMVDVGDATSDSPDTTDEDNLTTAELDSGMVNGDEYVDNVEETHSWVHKTLGFLIDKVKNVSQFIARTIGGVFSFLK